MAQHKSGVINPLWDPVCWLSCIGLGLLGCLLLLSGSSSLLYLLLNGALAIGAALWTSHRVNQARHTHASTDEQGTIPASFANAIIGLEEVC